MRYPYEAVEHTKTEHERGFTFVEVLVAMLIFVMSVVASIELIRGAVQATVKTKEITVANWLLQNTMTELETKIDTLGFEQGCEEKAEAKFADPYGEYRWRTSCTQIDFQLSETASKLAQAAGVGETDESTTEDLLLKQLLTLAGDYMADSSRELHAEVFWDSNGTERSVSATTHTVNLNSPFQLPNFGGGETSTEGETGSDPGTEGTTPVTGDDEP